MHLDAIVVCYKLLQLFQKMEIGYVLRKDVVASLLCVEHSRCGAKSLGAPGPALDIAASL